MEIGQSQGHKYNVPQYQPELGYRPQMSKTMRLAYAIMRGQASENRGPLYSPLPALDGPGGCYPRSQRASEISSIDLCQIDRDDSSDYEIQQESTKPIPDRLQCQIPSQDDSKNIPLGNLHSSNSKSLNDGIPEASGEGVKIDNEGSIHHNPKRAHLDGSLPRILSESQLSYEYSRFVVNVDDEEGDPRDMWISPRTFAEWAKGAVKRDPARRVDLVPELNPSTMNYRTKNDGANKIDPVKRHFHYTQQFDMVTCESLSPLYSVDNFPSPLLSPQGVNNNLYPISFAYSYPLADIQYKRATYYDAGIPSCASENSTLKTFDFEGINDALGSKDDSESGLRCALEFGEEVEHVKEERDAGKIELRRVAELNRNIRRDIHELSRDIAILEQATLESIEKTKRRQRYITEMGKYLENVTQSRDHILSMVEAFNKTNEELCQEAGRLICRREKLLSSLGLAMNWYSSSSAEGANSEV